jgi:3-deoxy-D-manno-octulosonate cytidylyltransferase
MKILGIIPARYASSRFPGKPLALINGKTMIQRVHERVSLAKRLDAVVVATDDDRIADVVKSFGGHYVMTSPDHQSGTDRCSEALSNMGEPFDAVVNIQGDEPFIDPDQIDLVAGLISENDIELASLAKKITDNHELFSPNTVKVVMDKNAKALYFSRHAIPYLRNVAEQEWMKTRDFYKHVGIYAYKSETLSRISHMQASPLEKAESLEQLRWLENGLDIKMGITDSENISIDAPGDIEKAEQFDNAHPSVEPFRS